MGRIHKADLPCVPSHGKLFGHVDYRQANKESTQYKEQVNTMGQREIGQPVELGAIYQELAMPVDHTENGESPQQVESENTLPCADDNS